MYLPVTVDSSTNLALYMFSRHDTTAAASCSRRLSSDSITVRVDLLTVARSEPVVRHGPRCHVLQLPRLDLRSPFAQVFTARVYDLADDRGSGRKRDSAGPRRPRETGRPHAGLLPRRHLLRHRLLLKHRGKSPFGPPVDTALRAPACSPGAPFLQIRSSCAWRGPLRPRPRYVVRVQGCERNLIGKKG